MILEYLHENFGIGAYEYFSVIFIFVAVLIALYGKHTDARTGDYGSGGTFIGIDFSGGGGDCDATRTGRRCRPADRAAGDPTA